MAAKKKAKKKARKKKACDAAQMREPTRMFRARSSGGSTGSAVVRAGCIVVSIRQLPAAGKAAGAAITITRFVRFERPKAS